MGPDAMRPDAMIFVFWMLSFKPTFSLSSFTFKRLFSSSCKTCKQVKRQQLELDMEQHTGSKPGKEYVKAVYCHPAYLIYNAEYIMRNTGLDEAQDKSIKLELPGEISITSDMQLIPPLWQKAKN